MKVLFTFLLLLTCWSFSNAQNFEYNVSAKQPYGKLNPGAPAQSADYAELIGMSTCKSVSRLDQTTWSDTVQMKWVFKYIMNGNGVQDETFKEDGTHSGSIRQYNVDSSAWYVHYYTSAKSSPQLPAWSGNREGTKIILYKDQKAPNGFDGYYKIVFSDISQDSFNWTGSWVSKDESVVYPTWRIYCKKEQE